MGDPKPGYSDETPEGLERLGDDKGVESGAISGEKPEGLELSRATQKSEKLGQSGLTEGMPSRVEGVNPNIITRPGENKFNEEVSPGNYGGGIPEDLLERPDNVMSKVGGQGGEMSVDKGMAELDAQSKDREYFRNMGGKANSPEEEKFIAMRKAQRNVDSAFNKKAA